MACPGRAARFPAWGGARAFSLIELLIVIAIVAAVGMLTLPPLARWVGDYRFRETLEQFGSAMDSCRVTAQREGRALRVRATVVGGRLRIAVSPVEDAAEPATDRVPEHRSDRAGDVAHDAAGAERSGSPGESAERVRFEFPPGFTTAVDAPGDKAVAEQPAGAASTESGGTGDDIAILLPDGTAASGGPVRIRDKSGRNAETSVDRWAGRVRLRPALARAGERP